MRIHICALACAVASSLALGPAPAGATSDKHPELVKLESQIEAMRLDYEARLRALEQRVAEADQRAKERESAPAGGVSESDETGVEETGVGERAASPSDADETAPSEQDEATRSESVRESAAAAYTRFNQVFNPMVAVILQGRASYLQGGDGERSIPGFLVGGETGRGPEGLALGESELVFSANVDNKLYGFFALSFDQDEVGIEEAYLSTLSLPLGFSLKAGQFLSAIGYQNDRHSHAWDFVDQPLAYESMLGGSLSDAGLQISWIAPTDVYLELGGEILRGDAFPAGGAANRGFGSVTAFGKLSGDVGDSSTWKLGLAYLRADSNQRDSEAGIGTTLSLDGSSDLIVADFVWKWAADGNFRARNFTFQTEYLHHFERGRLSDPAAGAIGRYRGNHDGFYVQGVYQFVPRWRAGLRYGQLFSDNQVRGLAPNALDSDDASPRRVSAMLDYSNSEFSRLRLQYSFESGGLGNDSLVFLQYIISLGAHGAHAF